MRQQIHAYYSGRVHGIGFRVTARSIAEDLQVCGWAKNLPDGRVEVVAEAEEDRIKEFLGQLYASFPGYIQDVKIKYVNAFGQYQDFEVRF